MDIEDVVISIDDGSLVARCDKCDAVVATFSFGVALSEIVSEVEAAECEECT